MRLAKLKSQQNEECAVTVEMRHTTLRQLQDAKGALRNAEEKKQNLLKAIEELQQELVDVEASLPKHTRA